MKFYERHECMNHAHLQEVEEFLYELSTAWDKEAISSSSAHQHCIRSYGMQESHVRTGMILDFRKTDASRSWLPFDLAMSRSMTIFSSASQSASKSCLPKRYDVLSRPASREKSVSSSTLRTNCRCISYHSLLCIEFGQSLLCLHHSLLSRQNGDYSNAPQACPIFYSPRGFNQRIL